ncbi:unnamed protein product [Echinostoma caproni]|uniref:PDZ domain-containing protein n=1 Tax=Echinostoma caproni TaxID=27848 RepID=A0A3P8K1L0_9TREM|nr:unnamed protein product [Echinostoma caproni]
MVFASRLLSGSTYESLSEPIRRPHGDQRTDQQSSHFGPFAIGAGFGLLWWYLFPNEKFESSPTFPLTVYCAEKVKPQPSKERLSAIRSLDVVADVAQEVQPAVVSITSRDKGFLSRHIQSSGSGFIIDDSGHVITNAHVVGYRSDVFVHLSDGRSYPGRVLAVDVSSDLALIQLDVKPETARSLPQLPLARDLKSVRPGHFVLALGSPLMLANSVTVGVVSALDRDLGHSEGLKYIQTDAIITVGNSGGPLVNLYGEVIGVNSMIAGIGVGFAIPVDQVRKFSELALQASQRAEKSAHGTPEVAGDSYILTESGSPPRGAPQRRYLGLVMRTLTPELAFELASRGGPQFLEITEGVLIHAILRNSPAQKAGLRAGDVIVAIDGLPITNAQQVYAAAENRDELTITIIRRGQRLTISGVRTEKV